MLIKLFLCKIVCSHFLVLLCGYIYMIYKILISLNATYFLAKIVQAERNAKFFVSDSKVFQLLQTKFAVKLGTFRKEARTNLFEHFITDFQAAPQHRKSEKTYKSHFRQAHITLFCVGLVEIETSVEVDGCMSFCSRTQVLAEQGTIIGMGTMLNNLLCTLNGRFSS